MSHRWCTSLDVHVTSLYDLHPIAAAPKVAAHHSNLATSHCRHVAEWQGKYCCMPENWSGILPCSMSAWKSSSHEAACCCAACFFLAFFSFMALSSLTATSDCRHMTCNQRILYTFTDLYAPCRRQHGQLLSLRIVNAASVLVEYPHHVGCPETAC